MTDTCDAGLDASRVDDSRALSPLRSWLAVSSVAIGTFALVTTEFLPIGLLTSIAGELGITEGTAGLMVMTPALVAAVAAPVLLLVAGRMDRRVALASLSAVLVVSNILAAFAPDLTFMLLARFLLGLSVGGFWAIAASVGARLVPPEKAARATSLILAGVSLGTILGVPAGSLIGEFAGWRAAFLTTGALAGLVLVAQLSFLPALPTRHAIVLDDLIAPFRNPVARLGIIAAVLMAVGQFTAYTYMEPFLRQVPVLSQNLIAATLLGYGLAGLIGNFAGGLAVERSLRNTLIGTAALLAGSMLLLPIFGASMVSAIVLVVVWGLAFGAMPVSLQTWTLRASPEAPEGAMAVLVSVFQIALASGAFFGGMAVDGLGVSSVMYLAGALMVATVAVVVLGRGSPENAPVPAEFLAH